VQHKTHSELIGHLSWCPTFLDPFAQILTKALLCPWATYKVS